MCVTCAYACVKNEGPQILLEALKGCDDKAALLDPYCTVDLSLCAAWPKGQSRHRAAPSFILHTCEISVNLQSIVYKLLEQNIRATKSHESHC